MLIQYIARALAINWSLQIWSEGEIRVSCVF